MDLPLPIKKVCIFGAGQFGFALAKLLGDNHPSLPVVAFDPVKEIVECIKTNRTHPIFHKGVTLHTSVTATHDKFEALADADLLILATPAQFIRDLLRSIANKITKPIIILNVAKALERGTNKVLSEVVHEEMSACQYPWWFAALSGGMIAEEVTKSWPIAADIACKDIRVASALRDLFHSPYFKVQTTTDVYGVELAGALKNVVAIGAGFFDGMGFEMSSKAAYVSEAAREIRHLAMSLGASAETFDLGTHAWLGDLLTTCFGKSRNRLFGELLGSGMSVEEALKELERQHKIAEGYLTTKCFYETAKEKGIEVPIIGIIYDVLFSGAKVADVILSMFK